MTNEKSKNGIKLGQIVTIISALSVITISIIATHASFPPDIFHTLVVLLVTIIIIFIVYGFLAHPISNFIKRKRKVRKHNALARKYFDEFKDFTNRFGEFVESNRCDNIPYALRDLSSSPEFRNISFLSTQDIHNLFYNFEKRLKRFDGTKEDFSLLANEFDTLMDMYNEFCIRKPVEEIRRIGQDKVNERIKRDYRKHKGTYERFVEDYIGFGKKVNRGFGRERIVRTHFETPGEL
ncbi:MAG: hypothetical protein IB616_05005 [Methanosarcinales archaeon]|nr:MAG: hypothetical protein IB616_05005 [Methanosarcinales archaeon]